MLLGYVSSDKERYLKLLFEFLAFFSGRHFFLRSTEYVGAKTTFEKTELSLVYPPPLFRAVSCLVEPNVIISLKGKCYF